MCLLNNYLGKSTSGTLQNLANIVSAGSIDKKQNTNIDWDFISKLEGSLKTEGNVPDHLKSKSGVTISTGFDLGARNKEDLNKLKLPSDLVKKLEPYLTLQGAEAYKYEQKHPLSITKSEAELIYKAAKKEALESLVKRYDDVIDVKFSDLTREQQTVIASVSFQYGTGAPTFWMHATKQDWGKVLETLRDFQDRYPTRRTKEANYLEGKK